jgi:hypothetical protein
LAWHLVLKIIFLITKTQSYSIPLIGCLNTAKVIPAFISDIEMMEGLYDKPEFKTIRKLAELNNHE